MMLSDDLLVPRGSSDAFAGRILELLNDPARLRRARDWARRRAAEFDWDAFGRMTSDRYRQQLERIRS
jgi:glycosyltransferase involved in cell wall biosynthesis